MRICYLRRPAPRPAGVHHFVDNEAAKAGLIKGTSSSPHTALVLLDYHITTVELQCDPWVGFVYSEDNLSDPPSRGDFRPPDEEPWRQVQANAF